MQTILKTANQIPIRSQNIASFSHGKFFQTSLKAINHIQVRSIVNDQALDPEKLDDTDDLDGILAQKSPRLGTLENVFLKFEQRVQNSERVNERDFVKTFDLFTKTVEKLKAEGSLNDQAHSDLALMASILLRCCGKLMYDTSPKTRELLAGNLWQFLKEKKMKLDLSHYNSLLRVLNENQTNFDPQKIIQEMSDSGIEPDRITYQRLIHQYCLQGDIANATSLLEKMKEKDMQLNENTFASLIIGYSHQEKPPALDEMFELMRSNNIEPSGAAIAAAIISRANVLGKDPSADTDQLEKLADMIQKEEIMFNSSDLADIIDSLCPHIEKNSTVKTMFDRLCFSPSSSLNSRFKLVSCLIRNNQLERASEIYWSNKPSARAIQSGGAGLYYIKLLSTAPTDFAIRECSKLLEMSYNPKAFYHLYSYAAEVGSLQTVRAALIKVGEEIPLKCQYFWPLLAQAKDQDEIVKVLKNDLNPGMDTSELLDTFSDWVWPRFFDNAKRLFELNQDLKYDNSLLVTSFLNYSLQENKIHEAIKFLSELPQDMIKSNSTVNSNRPVNLDDEDDTSFRIKSRSKSNRRSDGVTLVGRILNRLVEDTKDPSIVKKAWQLCKIPGYQMSNYEAQPLIKVHLMNNDFDGALEAFLSVAKSDGVTPCKEDLIINCLNKKDPESLRKIMKVSTDIYGESNALFDLATCCLMTDKVKHAQKIFASPGFRVSPSRVYRVCQRLSDQGNLNALESFVQLTRDMYDVNQDYLTEKYLNKK